MGVVAIQPLIPIPEAASYGIAVLVTYGLSSASLASYARLLPGLRRRRFVEVHLGILAVVVAWGFLVVGQGRLLPGGGGPSGWGLSILIGLGIGPGSWWCDHKILRWFASRRRVRAGISGRSGHPGEARPPYTRSLFGSGEAEPRPWELAGVAVLEELVYRGFLVSACFLLPGGVLTGMALTGVCLAFAFSHAQFGLEHVVSKISLSALALGAVLVTHSVIPAVLGHVAFNLITSRTQRIVPQRVSYGPL